MCPTPNPDIHSERDQTAYGILAHAIRLARQEAELRGVGWACLLRNGGARRKRQRRRGRRNLSVEAFRQG